jgi:ATP/maltotriose-dependent transcriptional regulator MalT
MDDANRNRVAWYDNLFDQFAGMWVPAARGDRDSSRCRLSQITRYAQTSAPGGRYYPALGRALVAQANGDYQQMYQALGSTHGEPVDLLERAQTAPWWLPLLAEAEIGVGRFAQARETLTRLGDIEDAPYLHLQAARLRAWMAERQGDTQAALHGYEQTAEWAATAEDTPLYRAMLDLSHGRLLRAVGQRRRATERLQSACTTFSGLGATPYLIRCAEELARCGQQVPRQRTGYTQRLTDREREVVHFAGMGKTNREIAEELVVSTKTVEYHLGNVYLKLAISGRRELRDLVQAGALADTAGGTLGGLPALSRRQAA